MQNRAANTTELSRPATGCYQVLLCLLLLAFSTASYAASSTNSEKSLKAQSNPDSIFIVNLPSPVSETQAEEPELDKAIDASSPAFQSVIALGPVSLSKNELKIPQWNWHLVRGPPAAL